VWLSWGGSGAEGKQFRVARGAWWPSTSLATATSVVTGGRGRWGRVGRTHLADQFQKRNEKKKIETGWAARGFWAKITSGRLRKIKIVFNFLIQGNGFKSKDLNISKPNLNWIQNRINSNQLSRTFHI
jgi:hypothetical protein